MSNQDNNENGNDNQTDDGPDRNEAVRVFASEFNEAKFTFKKEDKKRAAEYNLLPTGVGANRVLMMGTLMGITHIKTDNGDNYRARIVDNTGTFFAYAGQYSDATEKMSELQPDDSRTNLNQDEFKQVMIIGKAGTYEKDDNEHLVSVEPEHFIITDRDTRKKWRAETVAKTLDRLEAVENGEAPVQNKVDQLSDHFDRDGLRSDINEVIEKMEGVSGTISTNPQNAV
jgi:RPA family protein